MASDGAPAAGLGGRVEGAVLGRSLGGEAGEPRFRRALEGLLGVPATEGNSVEVLRNGDEIFPAMLDAIRAAHSTVDLLTFIYWTGEVSWQFAGALSERAQAGVRVRVLLDAIGARSMNRDLIDEMEGAGVQVEWFRKPTTWRFWETNHRTHRKVLICDEEVAFTGGVGIAQEWQGNARNPSEWRDTHFRVRGPAVDGLRAAFVDNWAETGNLFFDDRDRFPDHPAAGSSCVQVVRGSAEVGWSDMATLVRALVCLARRRLYVTTAYFVPDEATRTLLCQAARRGVDVRLLLPGRHADKRFVQLAGESRYTELLDAGARVWNYQRTMLHAKVMTVDGQLANVGSSNFDGRSLARDEEVNLAVMDPAVVEVLDRHFAEDLEDSEEIDRRRWRRRRWAQRAKELATTPLEPQI